MWVGETGTGWNGSQKLGENDNEIVSVNSDVFITLVDGVVPSCATWQHTRTHTRTHTHTHTRICAGRVCVGTCCHTASVGTWKVTLLELEPCHLGPSSGSNGYCAASQGPRHLVAPDSTTRPGDICGLKRKLGGLLALIGFTPHYHFWIIECGFRVR